ncbi:hypothetical protein [Deinococcus multiflagellatus]|uniref:hypothetical protein n=1 Tax=Deinococcus multiflagellatus TaxID=1656887 RepID=UPI001CC8FDA2|nr:hypothetical protein [Deinococcus multiflagellatus]MBZ9713783.1 hypothetical protein [Deinococcus multiflagellatus]
MDVLTAHNPRGFLHAVTLDWQAGFGASFEQTMQRQGCTVRRYPLADYLAQQQAGRQNKPTPAPASSTSETPASGTVPDVGAELVHPLLGRATVTHHVTLDGRPVAVAASPRGAGLVREWQPVPAEVAPVLPAPVAAAAAAETGPPPRAAAVMPSLFGGLA